MSGSRLLLPALATMVAALLLPGCSKKEEPPAGPAQANESGRLAGQPSAARDRASAPTPESGERPELAEPDDQTGVGPDGTRVQRRSMPDRRFTAYDRDGDGKLDDAERASMIEERIDRTFGAMDGDSDGALSQSELESSGSRMARRLVRRFERIDADSNGTLSRKELEQSMTRGSGQRPAAPAK